MKRFSLLLAVIAFFGASCERHEFDGPNGTKKLHQHGHHGEHHGDDHGDDHGKDKDHADDKAH